MSVPKFISVAILNLKLSFSGLTHFVFIWLSRIFANSCSNSLSFKSSSFLCLKYSILFLSPSISPFRRSLSFISSFSCSLSSFITSTHFLLPALFIKKWDLPLTVEIFCDALNIFINSGRDFTFNFFIITTCFTLSLIFRFINSWKSLLIRELIA